MLFHKNMIFLLEVQVNCVNNFEISIFEKNSSIDHTPPEG